jgi:hypothetical protein
MRRPPRPVVVLSVRPTVVAMTAVDNGYGLTADDLAAYARSAGLDPRTRGGKVFVPTRRIVDLVALLEYRNVVVIRRAA